MTSLQQRLDDIQSISESKEKQLITIEPTDALDLFTDEGKLKELLSIVKVKARSIVPDVYTDKGRKELSSMAYSIARTKTYLDSIGKDLVSHYKEIPKKIDSGRKFARDKLDLLRDEIRKPLDDWEAEQARLKLLEEIADCHIVALDINRTFDEARKIALELEELERIAMENLIKERAFKEAELKMEQERKELAIKHQRELDLAEERRLQAIKDAEIQKEQAIIAERKRAAEQAEIINAKKRRDEEQRLAAERHKEEQNKKLMEDIAHRELVQLRVLNDLMLCSQITNKDAKCIIQAIDKGLIPDLLIKY